MKKEKKDVEVGRGEEGCWMFGSCKCTSEWEVKLVHAPAKQTEVFWRWAGQREMQWQWLSCCWCWVITEEEEDKLLSFELMINGSQENQRGREHTVPLGWMLNCSQNVGDRLVGWPVTSSQLLFSFIIILFNLFAPGDVVCTGYLGLSSCTSQSVDLCRVRKYMERERDGKSMWTMR